MAGRLKIAKSELSGWGRHPRAECLRAEPLQPLDSLDQFAEFAHLVPRGMGRSYGDASLAAEGDLVLATRWQNKFMDFDPIAGRIVAQAGVTLGEVLDVIIPQGWFLPVTPGTRFVSLGGALASNVHGKNHHRTGPIVNFVDHCTVLTEVGNLRTSQTENPELFRATIGGYGMTGLIQEVGINLARIETAFVKAHSIKVTNLDDALAVGAERDDNHEMSVTWMDCLASGSKLGRGIVMLGDYAKAKELPIWQREAPLANRWKRGLSAPKRCPEWLLNRGANRLMNFAYYHKNFGREQQTLVPFEPWFYPLDGIAGWNHFYGNRGFVEYQCALPKADGPRAVQRLLEHVGKAKFGSFLAVLKQIGDDNVTMPFAMPGYTLAMDFRAALPGLFDLLDELDRIVLDHGGRIYLSKDARLSASTFREMYPEFPAWQEQVATVAPTGRFRSALAERLAW